MRIQNVVERIGWGGGWMAMRASVALAMILHFPPINTISRKAVVFFLLSFPYLS
jgi:hypothetical protein